MIAKIQTVMRTSFRPLGLVAAAFIGYFLLYTGVGPNKELHPLLFLPVALSALFWGFRGGTIGTLVALLILLLTDAFLLGLGQLLNFYPHYVITGFSLLFVGLITGGVVQRERDTVEVLKRTTERLEALNTLAKELATIRSREEIFQRLADALHELFRYENPSVFAFDEARMVLRLAGLRGNYVTEAIAEIPYGEGVVGTTAKEMRSLVVPDVSRFPGYIQGRAATRSEIAVPIHANGKLYGVINVESDQLNAFSDEDRRLLESMAELAALSLHRLELQERLTQQAITDPLTGLYNRRYFFDRLREELARARRYGFPVSVLLVDLRNFKMVNDTLGHRRGDHLLHEVARVLSRHLRQGDVACRYGGDEFVIILPHAGRKAAAETAHRIHRLLRQIVLPELDLALDGNIGVATYPEDGTTEEDLVERADARMYQAKMENRPVGV